MRVLMTGGGTAGHVNPAIAIANTIKEYEPDAVIEFVSSNLKNDKARELVTKAGYKLHGVDICGRYPLWNPKNIKTAYLMIRSNIQAKRIIEGFKPDIIIGTGGFACYPLLRAGANMHIPTLVHESNAIPGRAVMKLMNKVDCVMTNFEEAKDALTNARRAVRVGNPTLVKKELLKREDSHKVRQVLSFGGSGGAEVFNDGICDMLSEIADAYPNTVFLHASGKRDHERMLQMFKDKGLDKKPNVKLVEYIYDMDVQMKNSDIVISRAGAMTLSELSLMGRSAILVPSPNVIGNHQYKNAKPIADAGACLLVEERTFADGSLRRACKALLEDADMRNRLGTNIERFAVNDANGVIYGIIKEYVK